MASTIGVRHARLRKRGTTGVERRDHGAAPVGNGEGLVEGRQLRKAGFQPRVPQDIEQATRLRMMGMPMACAPNTNATLARCNPGGRPFLRLTAQKPSSILLLDEKGRPKSLFACRCLLIYLDRRGFQMN